MIPCKNTEKENVIQVSTARFCLVAATKPVKILNEVAKS